MGETAGDKAIRAAFVGLRLLCIGFAAALLMAVISALAVLVIQFWSRLF
jgi:hypothetical protein